MAKIRIAIACQGGGSQTAFTAGALKGLFDARIEDDWTDNTAHGWAEELFNDMIITSSRLVNAGLLPSYQLSPSMPLVQRLMTRATLGLRRGFSDLRSLLETHLDFAEIAAWGPRPERPVLIIGAANVTTGHLAKFVSRNQVIRVEHLLASCAVPTIFPAVQIGPHAYWDGLFSDNPPVEELLRPRSVGVESLPDEIWLIKINPTGRAAVPVLPSDVIDRRNQLEGNISLSNDMLSINAFRPEFMAHFDVRSPVRIPKSFETDLDKPWHIPWIEMPEEMQAVLDYEGKIDRGAANIGRLMATGETAARVFLERRAQAVATPPPMPPIPGWAQAI